SIASGLLLVFSIAAVVVSRVFPARVGRSERFISDTAFLTASAFVFALLLQGAASTLLDPCQR
ncbi:hypothetical protein AB4144_20205, partial [Rhizobiaceae sp. 2RAB30]